MRCPRLVLVSQFDAEVGIVGLFHELGYIALLSYRHETSTHIAECIWTVLAATTRHVHISSIKSLKQYVTHV